MPRLQTYLALCEDRGKLEKTSTNRLLEFCIWIYLPTLIDLETVDLPYPLTYRRTDRTDRDWKWFFSHQGIHGDGSPARSPLHEAVIRMCCGWKSTQSWLDRNIILMCGPNPIVKTICHFIFPVQVASGHCRYFFAFVQALVSCQLQVHVGDFISVSLGMDAGIFLDVHERSICLPCASRNT